MDKKYEILYDQKEKIYDGVCCYRIRALKDFSDVKSGDIGGYVQSEKNLSQEGNCWIYDEAEVLNNAIVCDNAVVKNKAIVADNAVVLDDSIVKESAYTFGNSHIIGKSIISDHCRIDDFSVIKDATIEGYAEIAGNTEITGNVIISDDTRITNSTIHTYEDISDIDCDNPKITISKNAWVEDCDICGYDIVVTRDIRDCKIYSNAKIYDFVNGADLNDDAFIVSDNMYHTISGFPDCLFGNGTFYVDINKQIRFSPYGDTVSDMMRDKDNWENIDVDITYKVLDIMKMIFKKKCDIDFEYPTREELGL